VNTTTFYSTLIATLSLTSLAWTNTSATTQDAFSELDAATSSFESSNRAQEQAASEASAFEQFMNEHQQEQAAWEEAFLAEFEEYVKISQEETENFQKEIAQVWDEQDVSSEKVWVDYSRDLQTRSRVDFEKGQIEIATTTSKDDAVDKQALREKLRALLMKNLAQAFLEDQIAQAVEAKSKEKLKMLKTAKVEPKPILLPYVSDKEAPTEKDVDNIVDKLIAEKKPTVTQNKKGENVVTLTVPLVKEAKAVTTSARATTIPKGAKQLRGDVQKYAKQHKLDEALVFAIIETESAYNPMAKSPIPAFGLMQIVPSSAGMDATAMLFGEGRILSPSYLYTSDKNIEIGAAYLNILYYRYLKGVKDPLSRLYCSIAAYNTGAGNVSRAFIGSTKLRKALPKINALTPEQVYDHLIEHLPYEETRRYLKKVVTRMPKYTA